MISAHTATIFAALGACLFGCSANQIAQFETKVATKRCAKEAPTSPQYEQCVAGYYAQWEQEKAINREGVAAALAVGLAVRPAKKQGQSISPNVSLGQTEISISRLNNLRFVANRLGDDIYKLGPRVAVRTRYCHLPANYTSVMVLNNQLVFSYPSQATCTLIHAWSL